MFVLMSSTSFHPIKVSKVERNNKSCVNVTFDIPSKLKDQFNFLPGQYLTLIAPELGPDVRRSYSLCTIPKDDEYTVAIKKIENGLFSTFANKRLKEGDLLEVMSPQGSFTIDVQEGDNVVCFAAGSGITPILSHIKHILLNFETTTVTLFYGNKNFESILFREALEGLKNEFIDRLSVYHIFSREKIGLPIFHGRIDETKTNALLTHFVNVKNTKYFLLCGPNEMVFNVKETLSTLGVDAHKIKFELFNTDGLKARIASQKAASTSDAFISHVTIQMDGDLFEFELPSAGQNLLDAALENGADLPFSCKGGVCSTCKAKLIQGNVNMDLNYSLEPDEVENGYILMCQSHPTTSEIYIDFDQK